MARGRVQIVYRRAVERLERSQVARLPPQCRFEWTSCVFWALSAGTANSPKRCIKAEAAEPFWPQSEVPETFSEELREQVLMNRRWRAICVGNRERRRDRPSMSADPTPVISGQAAPISRWNRARGLLPLAVRECRRKGGRLRHAGRMASIHLNGLWDYKVTDKGDPSRRHLTASRPED